MKIKKTENKNYPIIKIDDVIPRQLKPIPVSKPEFSRKKKNKTYKSIGLFWDDYEILI
ncbi:MAG: hypothetical protein IIU66_07145 [Clostridia bacterium]|nr:hypothetical protein [Clostridia bacterium]